ncbi:MAG: nitroreductase family protein [Actinobacteria bacterium]|nr:nitroreductase family protein [Actinomycetota bacterium]
MGLLEIIRTRRSVRKFTGERVDDADVNAILEAGRWAPSGLNNQPWRFAVVRKDKTKRELAAATRYSSIILSADVLIAVFLDRLVTYDRTKDVQAIGACIQSMLLMAHSLGLGACWLGQILTKREMVERTLDVPGSFELMSVIAIGHPAASPQTGRRDSLQQLVFLREES